MPQGFPQQEENAKRPVLQPGGVPIPGTQQGAPQQMNAQGSVAQQGGVNAPGSGQGSSPQSYPQPSTQSGGVESLGAPDGTPRQSFTQLPASQAGAPQSFQQQSQATPRPVEGAQAPLQPISRQEQQSVTQNPVPMPVLPQAQNQRPGQQSLAPAQGMPQSNAPSPGGAQSLHGSVQNSIAGQSGLQPAVPPGASEQTSPPIPGAPSIPQSPPLRQPVSPGDVSRQSTDQAYDERALTPQQSPVQPVAPYSQKDLQSLSGSQQVSPQTSPSRDPAVQSQPSGQQALPQVGQPSGLQQLQTPSGPQPATAAQLRSTQRPDEMQQQSTEATAPASKGFPDPAWGKQTAEADTTLQALDRPATIGLSHAPTAPEPITAAPDVPPRAETKAADIEPGAASSASQGASAPAQWLDDLLSEKPLEAESDEDEADDNSLSEETAFDVSSLHIEADSPSKIRQPVKQKKQVEETSAEETKQSGGTVKHKSSRSQEDKPRTNLVIKLLEKNPLGMTLPEMAGGTRKMKRIKTLRPMLAQAIREGLIMPVSQRAGHTVYRLVRHIGSR